MIDLVFYNGNVLTMDASRKQAQSVAVHQGRIFALGTDDDLESLKNNARQTVDLQGATLMPGFIDAHTHFISGGMSLANVNLVGAFTMPEMQRRVAEKVETTPDGGWIVGRGWDHTKRTDEVAWPTKHDIDSVTTQHPVYLARVDGHVGWANSAALALAGITADSPDPYGGQIMRDERGEPTGILLETAKNLVQNLLPEPDYAARERGLKLALAEAARFGVTSIHDNAPAEDLALMRDFRERGDLTVRVNALVRGWEVPTPFLEPMIAIGARTGTGDDWIKLGALKLSLDGTLGSRTAAMLEPYSDDPGNTGVYRITQAELDPIVERAHKHHIQIALHAIGDGACRMALDSIERAIESHDWPDHRHRIEHEQVITREDMLRFPKLGIIASLQPCHAVTDLAWVEDRVGPERVKLAYAWRSFVDCGTRICLGTDWPVETLDPRVGLYTSVSRQGLDGNPPGGRWPEECLTIEEALLGYTLDAAYVEFAEDRKGSITPGKLADFVLLADDPTTIEPARLLDLQVLATIVDGRTVYATDARFEVGS